MDVCSIVICNSELLSPKNVILDGHLNNKSKSESTTQQIQLNIIESIESKTNHSQYIKNIRKMPCSRCKYENEIHFSSAYTGIASETPVGVHSGPHYQNAGIQGSYEESFIRGSSCPYWKYRDLNTHTRGLNMNAWNECNGMKGILAYFAIYINN